MDALSPLRADHETVEAKFAKYEQLGVRASKSKATIVTEVIELLSAHAAIEEELFYPALRTGLTDMENDVLEALREHHIVK